MINSKMRGTNYIVHSLQHTIPLLNTLNLQLQRDEPQIHVLHDQLQKLLCDILIRFVKPSVISAAVKSKTLDKCGYHLLENQRPDDEIIIGNEVRELLVKMAPKTCEEFFTSVRQYFITVCNYIVKTFPLNDEVHINAQVADIRKRQDTNFASVAFFVKKFHYTGVKALTLIRLGYFGGWQTTGGGGPWWCFLEISKNRAIAAKISSNFGSGSMYSRADCIFRLCRVKKNFIL